MDAPSQTQDDFLVNNMEPMVLEQKTSEEENILCSAKSCNPFPTLEIDF